MRIDPYLLPCGSKREHRERGNLRNAQTKRQDAQVYRLLLYALTLRPTGGNIQEPLLVYQSLRCRILERIRLFFLPIFRRPFPVFFVPTVKTSAESYPPAPYQSVGIIHDFPMLQTGSHSNSGSGKTTCTRIHGFTSQYHSSTRTCHAGCTNACRTRPDVPMPFLRRLPAEQIG